MSCIKNAVLDDADVVTVKPETVISDICSLKVIKYLVDIYSSYEVYLTIVSIRLIDFRL